jgi:hypothetical protein
MRMGGVVGEYLQRMRDLDAELAAAGDEFASIRTQLAAAVEVLDGVTNWIMTNGLASPVEALAGATPYLRIFGTVTGGWLLARLALGAKADLEGADEADAAWLNTKIASARFFAEQVLPTAAGLVPAVQAGSSVLYQVTPESLASV